MIRTSYGAVYTRKKRTRLLVAGNTAGLAWKLSARKMLLVCWFLSTEGEGKGVEKGTSPARVGAQSFVAPGCLTDSSFLSSSRWAGLARCSQGVPRTICGECPSRINWSLGRVLRRVWGGNVVFEECVPWRGTEDGKF